MEQPDGVTTGLVSLRKAKKSRGLMREMANSVTGTLRRGVRLRRSLALSSWEEGTFANPPHWSSSDSISPPLEYVRWLHARIPLSLYQLTKIPGPADV